MATTAYPATTYTITDFINQGKSDDMTYTNFAILQKSMIGLKVNNKKGTYNSKCLLFCIVELLVILNNCSNENLETSSSLFKNL